MAKRRSRQPRRKYQFFLNPYRDAAFTRCPRCDNKTNIRKFPLVIHIEPDQLYVLNKVCRYCTRCELIIARKSEVESLMASGFEQRWPEIIGNEYFIFGVLERKDWQESRKGTLTEQDIVERAIVFEGVRDFKPVYSGWVFDPEARRSK